MQYDEGDGGGILYASDAGQSHEHASTGRCNGQHSRQVARLMLAGSFELHPSFLQQENCEGAIPQVAAKLRLTGSLLCLLGVFQRYLLELLYPTVANIGA